MIKVCKVSLEFEMEVHMADLSHICLGIGNQSFKVQVHLAE